MRQIQMLVLFVTMAVMIRQRQCTKNSGTTRNIACVFTIILVIGISALTSMSEALGQDFIGQLWKSDGTPAGTVLVIDHFNDSLSSQWMINTNGTLLFTMNNQLWKSDGTTAGTVSVWAFTTDVGQNVVAIGNKIYFTVYSGPGFGGGPDIQLWASDGTSTGTVLITTISGVADFQSLLNLNGTLYFATVPNFGVIGQIWRSDGTAVGTIPIKSITVSNGHMYTTSNAVFFDGDDGSSNSLWKSDGTPNGTIEVLNNVFPADAVASNSLLYFSLGALWRSDGTTAGTFSLQPCLLNTGAGNLVAANGLLFLTNDDASGNRTLWKSDGTVQGTAKIANIPTTNDYRTFASYNNGLFFLESNSMSLWKSDGTAAGTAAIAQNLGSPNESEINTLTNSGSSLFFRTAQLPPILPPTPTVCLPQPICSMPPVSVSSTLWKTNGTANGTLLLKEFFGETAIDSFTDVNGTLFFTAPGGTTTTTSNGIVISSPATAVPNPAMAGETVAFSVTASSPQGNALIYSWDFGDGTTGSGATATHSYTAAGSYNATVDIADSNGNGILSSVQVAVTQSRPLTVTRKTLAAGNPSKSKDVVTIHFSMTGSSQSGLQTGELPSPNGVITVHFGSFSKAFTLKNGAGKSGSSTFSLQSRIAKGTSGTQLSKSAYTFNAKLVGNLLNVLTNAGFDLKKSGSIAIPFNISENNGFAAASNVTFQITSTSKLEKGK